MTTWAWPDSSSHLGKDQISPRFALPPESEPLAAPATHTREIWRMVPRWPTLLELRRNCSVNGSATKAECDQALFDHDEGPQDVPPCLGLYDRVTAGWRRGHKVLSQDRVLCEMGTRPTELGSHRVSPVPRIASAASMGQHASKVAQEQDTRVECSGRCCHHRLTAPSPMLLLCPALQLTGPREAGLWASSPSGGSRQSGASLT